MLDTNVVVSAALRTSSLEAFVIELVARRILALYASDSILTEYQQVLSRPKFNQLNPEHTSALLRLLAREATMADLGRFLSVSPDENDNRFLECSEAAEADYLVTGNKRHFPQRWKNTQGS